MNKLVKVIRDGNYPLKSGETIKVQILNIYHRAKVERIDPYGFDWSAATSTRFGGWLGGWLSWSSEKEGVWCKV